MERDPLFAELRALPVHAPSTSLEVRTKDAAHAALRETGAQPSLAELLALRLLLPTVLSGLTLTYLAWALQAASSLYPGG